MTDATPSPEDAKNDVLNYFDYRTNGFSDELRAESAILIQCAFEVLLKEWNDPRAHLRAMIRDLRQSSTDYSAVLEILILHFLIVKVPMNDLLNHLHDKGVHVSDDAKGNKSVPKDASPAERLRPSINTKLNRMSADGLIEIDSSLGARHRVLKITDTGQDRLNRLLLNPSQAVKAYLAVANIPPKPATPAVKKRAK